VDSWARILLNTDATHGRMAVEEHFASKPDTYLSVGHVVSGAKRVAWKLAEGAESEARAIEEAEWQGDPCPICLHELPIVKCDDCCSVLAHQVGHLHGQALWDWCDANLLKKVAA